MLSSHDTTKKKPLPRWNTEEEMVRTPTVKGSSFSNGDSNEANRSTTNSLHVGATGKLTREKKL